MDARVLVVIPAKDEHESLPRTVAELRARAPGVAIVVVDDGSRDATADVARRAGIPVVSHPINLGVGAALQTGFRYAVERGFDIVVQLDADGQHDPAYLEAVVAPVRSGACDVCIGSRYVSSTSYRTPLLRRLGMRLFEGVVTIALGRRIADTTSGFRAYGREVIAVCQHEFPRDFPDAPLLIDLVRRGFRLIEVPVEMRERRAGKSFYTFGKSVYYPYKNLVASLMAWLRRPA
jgi:glycosyltransferase involved in cell wall biosynthesis